MDSDQNWPNVQKAMKTVTEAKEELRNRNYEKSADLYEKAASYFITATKTEAVYFKSKCIVDRHADDWLGEENRLRSLPTNKR